MDFDRRDSAREPGADSHHRRGGEGAMNLLQGSLLGLAVVGVVLAMISRRIAKNYAQLTALLVVAAIILMPFVWLVCAAFKDKSVLNEYTLLPPAAKISGETINLDNFRTL